MAADVTVLVADAERMTAVRDGLRLPGRVLRFASSNLAAAFDSIRTNQPGLVAVDALFAQAPAGHAFLDRVDTLSIPGLETRLVALVNGAWATTPRASRPAASPRVDAKTVVVNTRRVPRFLVLDPLQAVVETANAGLIDISVRGAQIISSPALRPNQKIRVALPDGADALRVSAHIAWSLFEKPKHVTEPHYRAGIEFTDAATEALEDYCRRHGSEDPLPYRGRTAR